jgi:hypothetical protein
VLASASISNPELVPGGVIRETDMWWIDHLRRPARDRNAGRPAVRHVIRVGELTDAEVVELGSLLRDTLSTSVASIRGRDDEFVTTPSWNILHLIGSGDEFTLSGTINYPNGETWHSVVLITVRDGKIWRETDYFGPPFEAASWRAPFVEQEKAGARAE